jgi:uncharacterized membrane protein
LDRESLWVDEAFTVANARLPLDLIWTAQVDVHPPLYNTLMHAWLAVAGTSEFALRLPSALVSLTIVAGAYQAGRRLGGRPAAWTAALLAALSPTQLWYAQEGRNYALMMAMLSLGVVAYLDALRGRPSSCWRYVLPTVGAVLSNHSALGALAAQHLAAIPRLADADFRRWWLRAQALVAGLLLPWLAVFASQYEVWKRGFWLPWTRTTPPHRLLVDWWAGYAGWQLGMQRLLDAPWGPLQLAMLATMVLLAVLGVAGLLPRRAERTLDSAVAAGPAAVASPGLPIAGAAPTSEGASLKPWSAPRAGLATRLFVALGTILPAVLALVADHLNPNYHLRFTLAGHPVVLLLVAVGVTRVGRRRRAAPGAADALGRRPARHPHDVDEGELAFRRAGALGVGGARGRRPGEPESRRGLLLPRAGSRLPGPPGHRTRRRYRGAHPRSPRGRRSPGVAHPLRPHPGGPLPPHGPTARPPRRAA